MKTSEREKMLKAMEFIARQINDEDVFDPWLMYGIADGDIEYGDLDTTEHDVNLECYMEDDSFKDIMTVFLRRMVQAWNSGGLCCDGVTSKDKNDK